uniref:Uncharacterized protein n=1 Tax=Anguilla anguilla TaxID=7936 RepID=A0A0E9VT94_ANGAN
MPKCKCPTWKTFLHAVVKWTVHEAHCS